MKAVPMSFSEGIWKSFLTLLVFLLALAVWAYYPVTASGMSWPWAIVSVIMGLLTLWLFLHLLDWMNGVVQTWVGGVDINLSRLLIALGSLLLVDLVFGGLTYYAGWLAFGEAVFRGVNMVTILYTSGLTVSGVIGAIVVFSLIDLPNDALDGWVASKAAREPTSQIEVLRAQKMLHDVESSQARAQLARLRAKQESQMLPSGMEDGEWSMDEELSQY